MTSPAMTSLARIPCTIVTGFLGAGKTTLIRHVLANANGRRIAVIVNEFGDVGIDGEILKGCGDAACPEENIVELANGCLCCTVADDFVPALDIILAKVPRVEHIVIETSGLALPKPLVQAFHWPSIKSRVTVDGVVTVVDLSLIHISEPTRLLSISYAVFCLKKKKKIKHTNTYQRSQIKENKRHLNIHKKRTPR